MGPSLLIVGILMAAGVAAGVASGPGEPDVGVDLRMDRWGDELRLHATVKNTGPDAAKNVRLHLTLGDASWTITQGASSCHGGEENRVCKLARLASGSSWQVTAKRSDPACEQHEASARVHAPHDTDRSNNRDEASSMPTCAWADPAASTMGTRAYRMLRFTDTVSNHGAAVATNVVMTDRLPEVGATWRISGPAAQACDLDGTLLRCHWAQLGPFTSRTVVATAYGAACHPVSNAVVVTADNDRDTANNEDSDYVPRGTCVGASEGELTHAALPAA